MTAGRRTLGPSLARIATILSVTLGLLALGAAPGLDTPAWADRAKGMKLASQASKLYKRAQKDIPGAEKADLYAEIQNLIETILSEHNDSPPAIAFEDSRVYAGVDPNEIESFLERWRASNPDWQPGEAPPTQKAEVPKEKPSKPDKMEPPKRDNQNAKRDEPKGDDAKPDADGADKQTGKQVVVIPMPLPAPKIPPNRQQNQQAPQDEGLSEKELVQLLGEATVFLIVNPSLDDNTMSLGTGTGFFIGPDLIMTNQHVVEAKDDAVYAVSRDMGVKRGRYVAGTNMQGGEGLDVAIIQLEEYRSPTYLSFARSYFISQELVISGFPGIANDNDKGYSDLMQFVIQRLKGKKVPYHDGMAPSVKYSFGKLQGHYPNQSGYEVIQHGVQTAKGNSGSPVVNKCGEVIGIHALGDPGGKSDRGTKYNYAYSARDVVQFLGQRGLAYQTAAADCER